MGSNHQWLDHSDEGTNEVSISKMSRLPIMIHEGLLEKGFLYTGIEIHYESERKKKKKILVVFRLSKYVCKNLNGFYQSSNKVCCVCFFLRNKDSRLIMCLVYAHIFNSTYFTGVLQSKQFFTHFPKKHKLYALTSKQINNEL